MTNPARKSINPAGFSHENPIPVASQIGPFLATGVLTGRDPETRQMPEDLESQVNNVFTHIANVMAAAGGSPANILKLTVYLADYRDRSALNAAWENMFPNPASLPARQVVAAELDRGSLIQADVLAVLPEQ